MNRNLVLEALGPFGGARFVQKDPDIERVVTLVGDRDTVFVINRIGIVAVRAGVGVCHGTETPFSNVNGEFTFSH